MMPTKFPLYMYCIPTPAQDFFWAFSRVYSDSFRNDTYHKQEFEMPLYNMYCIPCPSQDFCWASGTVYNDSRHRLKEMIPNMNEILSVPCICTAHPAFFGTSSGYLAQSTVSLCDG